MSENDVAILGDEDFPPINEVRQESSISRRGALKWAAGISAGAVATGLIGRGILGFGEDFGVISTPQEEQMQAALINNHSAEKVPQENDPYITTIASRLGVKLLSLRQAYDLMGIPFNELDTKEFADVLPMRWDHKRAELLEECFGYLPTFFREKDGNGDPLIITLTNFGNNSIAGDYFMNATHKFMRLDIDSFSPDNPEGALEMLTHESVHHLQDLGYSRLNSMMPQLFKKDINKFCSDTIAWLDEQSDTPSEAFFLGMLRYGVQDTLSEEDPTRPRTNTTEFEAVLSEFYIHGTDFFLTHLGKIYGRKADDLYRYMRDYIFGGYEYEQFPIDRHQ